MKRIILGLLFDGESFYLSRNFRLQRLGNLEWLRSHFRIFDLTSFVDEVAVFHVSRKLDTEQFAGALRDLTQNLFVPLSVGGGVRTVADADTIFRAGADRVMFSGTLWTNPGLVRDVTEKYGKQAVLGVLNYSFLGLEGPRVRYHRDGSVVEENMASLPCAEMAATVGELVIQSIERDGTGQGFPTDQLGLFSELSDLPWVAAGGFRAPHHVADALGNAAVRAVLTSNLLAFVGTGLELARTAASDLGVELADWVPFSPR